MVAAKQMPERLCTLGVTVTQSIEGDLNFDTAKEKAARETAAVRNDNNRRPYGNERYGQQNQPDLYQNNQNHYKNGRCDAPPGPN